MNRRVIAIGTAATLGLLAVWYLLLWSPQSASLQKARTNATAAQQKEATLKTQVAALQKQRTQLPALQAQLAQLSLAIPTTPLIDKFIDQLDGAALGSGVTIQSIGATPPIVAARATATTVVTTAAASTKSTATTSPAAAAAANAPAAITINLTLTVAGSYAQLVDFINRLTSLPRLTLVDGVTFGAPAEKGKPMTVSISAHVLQDAQPASSSTATTTVGAH